MPVCSLFCLTIPRGGLMGMGRVGVVRSMQTKMRWTGLRRWTRRGGIATAAIAALLAAGYWLPRWGWQASPAACAVTIYVSGDGFHTNLTLPVETEALDWRSHLNLAELGQGQRDDYQYLSLGWGDRQFYLNTPRLEELDLAIALRAFLTPSDTVMHVQGHGALPQAQGDYRVEAVQLSEAGYLRLTDYVLASFGQDAQGRPVLIRQSHRDTGSFYAGVGRYGLWRTCNDWLAGALREAGARTPLWSGLAGSVFQHLESGCQR